MPDAATYSEEALRANKVGGVCNIVYVLFLCSNSSIQGKYPLWPVISPPQKKKTCDIQELRYVVWLYTTKIQWWILLPLFMNV